jgi:hypothetical protein
LKKSGISKEYPFIDFLSSVMTGKGGHFVLETCYQGAKE